ncbi:MAG: hypothetical protein ABEH83_05320 [Halobacterium sp.]
MLDELLPDEQSEAERELAPSVDVPDESDADPALQRRFWLLVLVFNVALMAVSVGAMLAVFRGQWDTGTSLVAAGLVLTAYGVYKYRVYKNADEADENDGDADDRHDAAEADDGDANADSASKGDTDGAADSASNGDADAGAVADLDAGRD